MGSKQLPQTPVHSNFWSGFTLGATAGAVGLWFFGTKKGRRQLVRLLELTENLEDTVEDVMGGIGEEYISNLAEDVTDTIQSKVVPELRKPETRSFFQSLKKIFTLKSAKRDIKRFEVQHGKIIE